MDLLLVFLMNVYFLIFWVLTSHTLNIDKYSSTVLASACTSLGKLIVHISWHFTFGYVWLESWNWPRYLHYRNWQMLNPKETGIPHLPTPSKNTKQNNKKQLLDIRLWVITHRNKSCLGSSKHFKNKSKSLKTTQFMLIKCLIQCLVHGRSSVIFCG